MDRKKIQNILLVILIIIAGFISFKPFEFFEKRFSSEKNTNISSSILTYGRFLDYLEMGWIQQVDLYDNSRNAIVQASSPELGNRPQTLRVDIPVGASQLIQKLKDYDVNFDAHPVPKKSIWITIAGNLLVPLIFIGGHLLPGGRHLLSDGRHVN